MEAALQSFTDIATENVIINLFCRKKFFVKLIQDLKSNTLQILESFIACQVVFNESEIVGSAVRLIAPFSSYRKIMLALSTVWQQRI